MARKLESPGRVWGHSSGLGTSPRAKSTVCPCFLRFYDGVWNRNKLFVRAWTRLGDCLSTHPLLPADVCHASLTWVQYGLLPTVVFKYCLLIFRSLASSPGFLLPRGQVVPHVGIQVLHVHTAPVQNQNQRPQKRAVIYGRPLSLLLAGGTPLSWNVRNAFSVAATRPRSPPPGFALSRPAVGRLRKPPPQVHPRTQR